MMVWEQDSLLIFDHIERAGPMWSGEGRREVSARVPFVTPFDGTPAVQVSIRMIDGDARSNLRLELIVSEVGSGGFTVTARTWSDTRIGRLAVNWLAIGRRGEDEVWDV